jgi:hypothetical protein
MAECKYKLLTCYAASFFMDNGVMWRHNEQGAHKHILYCNRCIEVISAAHDDVGHCRYYVTHALVAECYWWPFLRHDITWYVCTCHICQTRQMQQITIPPVVTVADNSLLCQAKDQTKKERE